MNPCNCLSMCVSADKIDYVFVGKDYYILYLSLGLCSTNIFADRSAASAGKEYFSPGWSRSNTVYRKKPRMVHLM